jgi:hypothetical protein
MFFSQNACSPKQNNNEIAPIEADSVYHFSILARCSSTSENTLGIVAIEVTQYAKKISELNMK